jgi:hypothetical protein
LLVSRQKIGGSVLLKQNTWSKGKGWLFLEQYLELGLAFLRAIPEARARAGSSFFRAISGARAGAGSSLGNTWSLDWLLKSNISGFIESITLSSLFRFKAWGQLYLDLEMTSCKSNT